MSLVLVSESTVRAVEGAIDGAGEDLVERAAVEVGVREEVDEHRGHVRLDHPCALGHRADDQVADAHGAHLGPAVGGQDGARGLVERAGPQLSGDALDRPP